MVKIITIDNIFHHNYHIIVITDRDYVMINMMIIMIMMTMIIIMTIAQ